VANLTVEAGDFCPATQTYSDTLRVQTFIEFYRLLGYDAVALGAKEIAFGFGTWKDAVKHGVPVLAANVFKRGNVLTYPQPDEALLDASRTSPRGFNGQYYVRNDHGYRLGVIGFVSRSAWKARKDTLAALTFKSPFEMQDLVEEVAGNCDHLTVLGEFTLQEAESLARVMPEINLIVASNIKIDQQQKQGRTVIIGLPPRGNNGNYLEWNLANRDSVEVLSKTVSLDTGAKEDSTIAGMLKVVAVKIAGPPPVPAKAVASPAKTPSPVMSKPASVTTPPSPPSPVPPGVPVDPDGARQ